MHYIFCDWTKTRLPNGVEQFIYVDEDEVAAAEEDGEEPPERLMMLPTDVALLHDPAFRPWVERYAKDKDLCRALDGILVRDVFSSLKSVSIPELSSPLLFPKLYSAGLLKSTWGNRRKEYV